jgi:hypothetical protein
MRFRARFYPGKGRPVAHMPDRCRVRSAAGDPADPSIINRAIFSRDGGSTSWWLSCRRRRRGRGEGWCEEFHISKL